MSSSTSSTMFLSNISVVDHAYIDSRGNVVGGSFNPSFFVTGEIDPVEQVVVDFSSVKKQLKQIIDDKENGFDHKLWFLRGYSAGTITDAAPDNGQAMVNINTPTTNLVAPRNSVKVVEGGVYTLPSSSQFIGDYVETELRKLHPGINLKVECVNNTDCHFPTGVTNASLFRYAHGLKESTSWGCKNISHGHLSYVQLFPVTEASLQLASNIAKELDDTIFIYNANITSSDDVAVMVEYVTQDRGYFNALYMKDNYKLVVLETETTVEHLVEYVAALFAEELDVVGVQQVLISEGLSKGACVTLGS